MGRCRECGTTDGVRPYGLCLRCVDELALTQRRQQGLPDLIQDEGYYRALAFHLRRLAQELKTAVAP